MARPITRAALAALLWAASAAQAGPLEPLLEAARAEKAPLVETLRALVSIESGSRDKEGLDRIAEVIAQRLRELGGDVAILEPDAEAAGGDDASARRGRMVRAAFRGSGAGKVLLIAHMDTVYARGALEKEPFHIDGGRAYGLAINDDKQGIAVILHALAALRTIGFRNYGEITVLVNGDEEIGSRGSRATITRLAAQHDATLSFEASLASSDRIALATAGIGTLTLKVHGKPSHAGNAPELGVNALNELAHQILQLGDLSDPAAGIKVNWTRAKADGRGNVIPAEAIAHADVRVRRTEDYERVERAARERAARQLLPASRIEISLRRGRPPLHPGAASEALAAHAREIYRELGRDLAVSTTPEGGGTDAAYAALQTRGPVIERMGLRGFGSHGGSEYVLLESIEPRIYLAARMIMDIGEGKAPTK